MARRGLIQATRAYRGYKSHDLEKGIGNEGRETKKTAHSNEEVYILREEPLRDIGRSGTLSGGGAACGWWQSASRVDQIHEV